MATIANSVAGMRAAAVRVATAAENITKSNVKDFKALDYTQTVDTSGSPVGKVNYRDPATIKTIDSEGNEVDMPNVSLDEELVNTQLAVNDFKANATVLKIAKQTQGALLDILA